MRKFSLKASLALWRRRVVYRKARYAFWHKRHNAAGEAKWKKLIEETQNKVELRKSQIAAHQVTPATGFDVSNNNGTINWQATKTSGHQFVYVKSGEGDWHDPLFAANVRGARSAGLKVGAYHFLRPRPGRTGAQEAAFFIERLHSVGLGKGYLYPVLDVEATQLNRESTQNYIQGFANALRGHGFKPMVYTGAWFWDPNVGRITRTSTRSANFGIQLWVSGYVPESQLRLPTGWSKYTIWQFTDKGQVNGVRGDVDLNKAPDLRKFVA